MRALWTLLVLVCLLAVVPEAAAAGDAVKLSERSLLIFGPGGKNADGVIAGGYVRERLPPKERPDERVGVAAVPFPSDQPYWMTGEGRTASCQAGVAPPKPLSRALAEARSAMELVECSTIFSLGDHFDSSAACSTELANAEQLAELAMLRGLSHHVEHQPDLAAEFFARAAGINPEIQWDTGYPPGPQQAYLLAREEIGKAEPARFGWNFSVIAEVAVYVDGRPVEPRTLVEIAPVPHLVQVEDHEGQITTLVLDPKPGGTSVLVDRSGATAALMAGPNDDLSSAVAETVLAAVASQWDALKVVVVDTTWRKSVGEPLVYRYDAVERSFETLSARTTFSRHFPPFADKVRLAGGGGVSIETGVPGADPHMGIRPGVSGQIRMGPGFVGGAGVDLTWHRLMSANSSTAHYRFAPTVYGSFGYRWRPKHVQTYVGIRLLLRIANSLVVYTSEGTNLNTGTAAELSFDIVTPQVPGVFIRIGGALGAFSVGGGFLEVGAKVGLSL